MQEKIMFAVARVFYHRRMGEMAKAREWAKKAREMLKDGCDLS